MLLYPTVRISPAEIMLAIHYRLYGSPALRGHLINRFPRVGECKWLAMEMTKSG